LFLGVPTGSESFAAGTILVPKISARKFLGFSKPLILLGFFAIRAVGIVKAEWQVLEPKQLTKQQTKEK